MPAGRWRRWSEGRASELYGSGLAAFVHEQDDRAVLDAVQATGRPPEFSFRMLSGAGEWRHLDARVTDLRDDRNLRGHRPQRSRHDRARRARAPANGSAPARRLRQPPGRGARDGRRGARSVQRRRAAPRSRSRADPDGAAAVGLEPREPLARRLQSRRAEPPGCQVKSPFSCVAVRRGTAVGVRVQRVAERMPAASRSRLRSHVRRYAFR